MLGEGLCMQGGKYLPVERPARIVEQLDFSKAKRDMMY